MTAKLIENGRAAYAFEVIEADIIRLSKEERNEYRSYIKRLPMMIKVNGLGQALAFYYAKGGVHYKIYKNLATWVINHYDEQLGIKEEEKKKEFVDLIVHLESDAYRMATTEVLGLLNWMRRFADGLVKNGSGSL